MGEGKNQLMGNPEFLEAAKRLLGAGKPYKAQEKLFIFSDDSRQPVLPREYWKLRAVIALLLDEQQSNDLIVEAGGISVELFEHYEAAFIAFASSRSPRFKRAKRHRDELIQGNIRRLILLAQDLPIDLSQRYAKWPVKPQ